MQELNVKIVRVTVLRGITGADIICLDLDLESAFPEFKYAPTAKIETASGNGVQWCREVLKMEPTDVIIIGGNGSKTSESSIDENFKRCE